MACLKCTHEMEAVKRIAEEPLKKGSKDVRSEMTAIPDKEDSTQDRILPYEEHEYTTKEELLEKEAELVEYLAALDLDKKKPTMTDRAKKYWWLIAIAVAIGIYFATKK